MWVGTQQVGVARSSDGCYIVANYFPGGNVQSQFETNVLPLKDTAKPGAKVSALRCATENSTTVTADRDTD